MTAHLERLEDRRLLSTVPTPSPVPASGSGVSILQTTARPSVTGAVPRPNAVGISTLASVTADVSLPNVGHGVSEASIKLAGAVTLTRVSDGVRIPANVNTTGGGDAIILTPTAPLDTNTQYRFNVTSQVTDTSGAAFLPFTTSFTTGATTANVDPRFRWEKVELPLSFGYQWTSLAVGPDGRLYGGTRTGQIVRMELNPDGTIARTRTIQTVRTANEGGERLITGLEFDPAASASRPTLWVTHGVNVLENAPNWSNKISKLTGRNLDTYTDVIFNLPRSARDHLINQPKFGPDGLLYVGLGSQSAQGAPDNQWGLRAETFLSGAILQINTRAITSPLNVKTVDVGGRYTPFKKGNPVRLFATGVRNAYDLLWTRDGKLLAPVNASASGGNSPAGGGAPALTAVPTQTDFLIEVQPGKYYGHPNPARNEFVLNGGNPTSGVDPDEVTVYPVGIQPNPNFQGRVWDFGRNQSANGIIEFSSKRVFGGALDGAILVAQWSSGDNIVILRRDANGKVATGEIGFAGLTQFVDPLDLVQHPTSGFLYVAEYGAGRVTLLRPDQGALLNGRRLRTDSSLLAFNDVRGGTASKSQPLVIRNRGQRTLSIRDITFTGDDAAMFKLTEAPNRPFNLGPGQYVTVRVNFSAAPNTPLGVKKAALRISSNDSNGNTILNVALRGLATPGLEGANEPSLQRLFDLYDFRTNAGDDNPADNRLPQPLAAGNDEVVAQTLVKAGTGPVTIQTLGAFLPDSSPAANFGWYNPAAPGTLNQVMSVERGSNQTVRPITTGWNQFDPGAATFGLYMQWPTYANRVSHSQDRLNTFDLTSTAGRKLRFYEVKRADGSTEPNAYLVAGEAITSYTDQQDFVLLVRNVRPVTTAGKASVAAAPRPEDATRPPIRDGVFSDEPLDPDQLA